MHHEESGDELSAVPPDRGGLLERVKGIEPSYEAWEAAVLPLNYTRSGADSSGWL